MSNPNSHDSSLRPVKWLVGSLATIFLGLGLATTTTPDRREQPDPPSVEPVAHNNELVQIDANMTEQMSVANADTGRQNHQNDPQLRRSTDENYLRQLEQHLADIDKMLARQAP